MKKQLILYALLLSVLSINAQTIYQVNQLVGSKWMRSETEGDTLYIEFSSKDVIFSRIQKSIYAEPSYKTDSEKYYLSNIIPLYFDYSKVGTKSRGKYIIFKNERVDGFIYEEIKLLAKDSMTLYLDLNLASDDMSYKEMMCYKKYKRVK